MKNQLVVFLLILFCFIVLLIYYLDYLSIFRPLVRMIILVSLYHEGYCLFRPLWKIIANLILLFWELMEKAIDHSSLLTNSLSN